jgi:hypothetical protein
MRTFYVEHISVFLVVAILYATVDVAQSSTLLYRIDLVLQQTYRFFYWQLLATYTLYPPQISASKNWPTTLNDGDTVILAPGNYSFIDVNPIQITKNVSIIGQNGSVFTSVSCSYGGVTFLNFTNSAVFSGVTFDYTCSNYVFEVDGLNSTVTFTGVAFVAVRILYLPLYNLIWISQVFRRECYSNSLLLQ